MRTTIDSGGRVVIPKAMRDRLGLAPGQVVELVERAGSLEIAPATTTMQLVRRGGVLVATSERDLPALTDEMVRATVEQVRR